MTMGTAWLRQADDLLRGRPAPAAVGGGVAVGRDGAISLVQLLSFVVAFGICYGAVMGTFGGVSGERLLQVVYSAVKVPLLLLATFALSLPSFYVLNALFGVAGDFGAAVRALLATQAGLTIILAGFAPFTALWYASSGNYRMAILFNAMMFGLASLAAQVMLRRLYRPLIERDARHRTLLRVWLVVYAFVGIQMGWLLRPFVGDPRAPTRFFREDTWGNAYVKVVEMVLEVLGR